MKSVKPMISNDEVCLLLEKKLKSQVNNLAQLDSGLIARTFIFSIEGKECIIQFNNINMSQGYRTELFFSKRFAFYNVPVRKIMDQGEYNGLYYTISEKVQGEAFDHLTMDEFKLTLPSVIDTLIRISSVDLEGTIGYGWINNKMNGIFSSWQEHLMQVKDEEPGAFYGEWHHLFNTTFLEKQVFDRYYGKMEDLLNKIPVTRELVHGGFGYGNVLVHNHKVSAIIDWQDSRYGDTLFDLSYMTFWRQGQNSDDCINVYRDCIDKNRFTQDNFEYRVLCYKYYIGLDAMRFAAKTDNIEFYKLILNILDILS